MTSDELVFCGQARCVVPRFHCNGLIFLLSFCLCRVGRIENPSCSAYGHPTQYTSHLFLNYPATDSTSLAFRRLLFYLRTLVHALGKATVILPEKKDSLLLSGKFATKIQRQQTEENSFLLVCAHLTYY